MQGSQSARSNRNQAALASLAVRIAAAILAASATGRAQSLSWTPDPTQSRWYAEARAPSSWSAAESFARSFGGHLATVRSQPVNDWLTQAFLQSPFPYSYHWIGAFQNLQSPHYSEPFGGWEWASGEPYAFTNWEAGQPDDAGGNQHFARTSTTFAGSWADDTDTGMTPGVDWYVPAGNVVVFDTVSSTIATYQLTFAPGSDAVVQATPAGQMAATGGVIEIDDFVIEPGATLKIEGPNPFTLIASGRVVVNGLINASGNSNGGVSTLNTTQIPEPGALGQAGGGRGGVGSPSINFSSPHGGPGFGAFDVPDLGGKGGETGWSSTSSSVNARRGAGGGGGAFGRSQLAPAANQTAGCAPFCAEQRRIGFDAESGFSSSADNGALSGPAGPFGGAAGDGPFRDTNDANDFYGLMRDVQSGAITLGELARPWAGAGGGGGGDASRVPNGGSWPPPWDPTGDEKGSGGAGGGGSVHVLALGHIAFGSNGQIRSRGGFGGGGENTNFLDRVGGGSGGGSGGHVVLESATRIDLTQKLNVNWNVNADNNWAVDVRGGQGGAGANDIGGAQQSPTGQKETLPLVDACPAGYPTSGTNGCKGHVDGAGGDGGPGLIQLHTPNGRWGTPGTPGADILIVAGVTLDQFFAPLPIATSVSAPAPTHTLVAGAGKGIGMYELESPDCDGDGAPDLYEIALEPALDADGNGVLDACQPAVAYCSTSTTTNGCVPSIGFVGLPSASASSGFDILVTAVDGQRAGTIFYGSAPLAAPWGATSTLCVTPPVQRTGPQSSNGTPGACNGQLHVDWNAWRASHPGALGSPFAAGQTLFAQGWFRDGGIPQGSLSNALQFTLVP
jgi:hypothetical protein